MTAVSATEPTSALPPAERRISRRIGAHRRVRDARRRRQGQGAQGRRAPVIGFGAGEPDFPTPDYIVEAAVEACRDPRTTATPRPAGCPSSRRRSPPRRCATPGYEVDAGPGAGHQRRQAGGLRGVRHDARPGRRGAPAGAVLDDLPGGDPARRRRAGRGARRRDPAATWSPSSSSRRRAPTRTKVLLFCSPSNPTGAVYPAEQVEAIGRWALEHGLWVVTDEIYEHLVYGGAEPRLDAGRWCPSWPTAASSSTASPRPTR